MDPSLTNDGMHVWLQAFVAGRREAFNLREEKDWAAADFDRIHSEFELGNFSYQSYKQSNLSG